jgi:murein L,D-transpeptidase YafK
VTVRRTLPGFVTVLLLALSVLTGSSRAQAPEGLPPVDRIEVYKAARLLLLLANGREVYRITGIQLGDEPAGPKRFRGDERTPEGLYQIDARNPRSAYYLSLRISYPNAQDRAFAAAHGRSPGGDIFIHGQPNDWPEGRVPGDWTDGCIAVPDDEMELLWEAVPLGTPIAIFP